MANVEGRGVPNVVGGKLAASTILFLGYSLEDWDFRTIFKTLMAGISRPNTLTETCRWNAGVRRERELSELSTDATFEPDAAQPFLFHLFGHFRLPESIVLTERDYFDFLVAVSRDDGLLPLLVRRALATSSLLMIGMSTTGLAHQVVTRGLLMTRETSLRRLSLTVQPVPHDDLRREYLERHFGSMQIRPYWASPDEFALELGERWNGFLGS